MKKIGIAVIVGVIAVGGYVLLRGVFSPSITPSTVNAPAPSASASPASESQTVQVIYSDSGYSPNTITIKTGGSVTFKNQSSRTMWTASGIHPTHRAYPTTGGCIGSTFDACQEIQPGGEWSFTFVIPGTWKYHNHLNFRDTGRIIVE